MNCLRISELEKLAASLVKGATMELHLTPKPGLVDLADSGSHSDLSVSTMERSIRLVSDCLNEMTVSLANGEPFACQNRIGIQAEQRLFDDLGTNTHKGFIFLSSMLLIARWHADSPEEQSIRKVLSALADDFFKTGGKSQTNGRKVRNKYNAGGIVRESVCGFPSVFEEALPTFRKAIKRHGCFRVASYAMLARLMQTVEDTTTLHRAGPAGLSQVKRDGCRLEQLVINGEDYTSYLTELNRLYIRLNITIGGVADMLGVSYGYLVAGGEISEENGVWNESTLLPGSCSNTDSLLRQCAIL